MIQPSALLPGDTIGILAPGRKISKEAIIRSEEIIQSYGFKVLLGNNLYSNKHSYFSGLDSERLHDLQSMLDEPSVKAIICARGGYGTTRIIDELDFSSFLKKPKWICGFSDITALHLKLHSLGAQSIHGTMPVLFSKSESKSSIESLMKIMEGVPQPIETAYHPQNKIGKANGILTGGNLSLIVDSLGTNTEIDTNGKILIIEEVDEHLYKIDRMMVQLKRAKKLQHLAGLAIGHLTDIKDTELPFGESVYDIIQNHLKDFNFPVGFNFPTGHENPNMAWISGSKGSLSVTNEKSILQF